MADDDIEVLFEDFSAKEENDEMKKKSGKKKAPPIGKHLKFDSTDDDEDVDELEAGEIAPEPPGNDDLSKVGELTSLGQFPGLMEILNDYAPNASGIPAKLKSLVDQLLAKKSKEKIEKIDQRKMKITLNSNQTKITVELESKNNLPKEFRTGKLQEEAEYFVANLFNIGQEKKRSTPLEKSSSKKIENVLFSLDSQPSTSMNDEISVEDVMFDIKRPSYETEILGSLGDEVAVPEKPKNGMSCWNCNEIGHSLNDCPQPRDPRMIQKNRKEMLKGQMERSDSRYHDSKWAKFVPGKLSDELVSALGLKNELPPWIYTMRNLGYPPGHLIVAKEKKPPLDFDDGNGESKEVRCRVELSDIHAYPGFNVVAPKGCYDESDGNQSCPRFRKHDDRQRLLDTINQEMKRKDVLNMDTEDDDKDQDLNTCPPPPLAPLSPDCAMGQAPSSPTLNVAGPPLNPSSQLSIPLQNEQELELNGSSMSVSMGTPLGINRKRSVVSLEAFAEGIVPFEANETSEDDPTGRRGNFKAIKDSIAAALKRKKIA